MAATDSTLVLSYHICFPGLGNVARAGQSYCCVATMAVAALAVTGCRDRYSHVPSGVTLKAAIRRLALLQVLSLIGPQVLNAMAEDGFTITPELAASLSPYIRGHILRFGRWSLDMNDMPAPLEPKLVPIAA